jgi:hypothetical protein
LSVLGLYDKTFYGLFYEFQGFDINASADITVNAPVPEPATILLLAAGMGGLGFIKRRRFISL